jgi:hypothetical protein
LRIDRIQYRDWPEAYLCTEGQLRLIAVTSLGPRLLSLCFDGGENLLYEDHTHFKVGAWRLYGGHRFTVAPESAASYAPDNQPCHVRAEGNSLMIEQRLDDGLLRGLEIAPGPSPSGFRLRHVLRNQLDQPWRGALWAITCVPPASRLVVPECSGPARFWTGENERYANGSSPQWRVEAGRVVIIPSGEKGKIGLRAERPQLEVVGCETAFVIQGPDRIPRAPYPDEDCNVEVFTCADYLELETLGPLTTLLPGQELTHEQQWRVVPRSMAADIIS